jgi:phosphoglycerate dehydrogenase-like enzyme
METFTIAIPQWIPEEVVNYVSGQAEIRYRASEDSIEEGALTEFLQGAAGLLCYPGLQIPSAVLEGAADLRVISNIGAGYDNLSLDTLSSLGILACTAPDAVTESTADHAFALLLAAGRRIVESDAYVRAGRWTRWSPTLLLGSQVSGATLGIVGFGRIGQAVARRARGFDMHVLCHSRTAHLAAETATGAIHCSLPELLQTSDFVVLTVPLTDDTRGLIGRDELALMKPTATLVNVSRGPVVIERELVAALRAGTLFAAALDVFEQEPLASDSELMSLPTIVLSPHIATATGQGRIEIALAAARNLVQTLRAEPCPYVLNPEARPANSEW